MADGKKKETALPEMETGVLIPPHAPQGRSGAGLSALLAMLIVAVLAALFAVRISFESFTLFVLTVLALVASYRKPRAAVFAFIIYTSSIIAPEYFSLYVDPNFIYWGAEIFLLVIVVGAVAQRTRETGGAFWDLTHSPVALSLLLLGAVVSIKSFAFLVETRFPQWAFNHVYTFNRSLGFLAIFVPVFLLFNTATRQRVFLRVLFVIGAVIAVRVILEAVFPNLWIFDWIGFRQSLSVEFPTVDPSILRLRAPGGSLVQVCFWMGLMNIILRRWTPRLLTIYAPLTLLMLTAILLEFNRSYVIPIVALVGVAMLLNQRAARLKLATMLAVIAMALLMLSLTTGEVGDYVNAFTERYGSAFAHETFETQSLNSRMIENGYAWDSIRKAPVFGIGINEYYRPPVPGMLDNLRWYIHDAYLWYWVYFGFIGLAALIVALVTAAARGLLNWKKVHDPFLRAGLLSLTFTLLTLAAASFYAPRFYEYGTVPVVAMIMGLTEAIIFADRRARAAGVKPLAEGEPPPRRDR